MIGFIGIKGQVLVRNLLIVFVGSRRFLIHSSGTLEKDPWTVFLTVLVGSFPP